MRSVRGLRAVCPRQWVTMGVRCAHGIVGGWGAQAGAPHSQASSRLGGHSWTRRRGCEAVWGWLRLLKDGWWVVGRRHAVCQRGLML